MRWAGLPLLFLLACSSTKTTTSSDDPDAATPTDAGGTKPKDGGVADGAADAKEDAGPVSGCTTYVDRSAPADERVETWDFSLVQHPERCMKIKVGQSVTFNGDFTMRPIAGNGGDSPNPFDSFDPSSGNIIAFPVEGTFGYANPDTPAMLGAIQVVP